MYNDNDVLNMYKDNIKITHIMKETGFSYSKIKRILVDNNIFVQKGNPNSGVKRRNHANDNYFEIIDTVDKAYWMGFIWGDGYITNNSKAIGISLSVIDIEHLDKFKKAISFTGDIKQYEVKQGYTVGTKFCRIVINSKKIVSDLKKHGLQEKKSKIMQPPNHDSIPEELIPHFIRGIQDANGSICGYVNKYGKQIYYTHIIGTMAVLDYIKEHIGYNTKQQYTQRKENCPIYDCRFTMNRNNIVILDNIYKNSTKEIRLDRKYNIYMEIKNFIQNNN